MVLNMLLPFLYHIFMQGDSLSTDDNEIKLSINSEKYKTLCLQNQIFSQYLILYIKTNVHMYLISISLVCNISCLIYGKLYI